MPEIRDERMCELQEIAKYIGNFLEQDGNSYRNKYGENVAYGLFLFCFETKQFTWVSNIHDSDAVKFMQEFIRLHPIARASEGTEK